MTANNKQIAQSLLQQCFAGDIDAAMKALAPDATWWTLGDPARLGVAGERNTEQIGRFLKNVHRGFAGGMQATFHGITAEGSRVAIEASSRATLADGSEYHNRYHFLIEIENGLVRRVREYLDTDYVHELQQRLQAPTRKP